jgi:hypothetical protein
VYNLDEELHSSQIARLHVANEPLQFLNHVGDRAPLEPATCSSGALKGWSMEKWLCWGSLGLSGVLLLLFLLDLILGTPFNAGLVVNSIGILACGMVGYLAWETYRELR